jgi:hypothetical protein
MSYDVSNIIQITTRISPAGLGFANFGLGTLFAPEAELPVGFDPDTYRVYNNLNDLSVDFADTTETYKAAARWFSPNPTVKDLYVYGVDATDISWATTLNKARNVVWWYWSFFTAAVYADLADVIEIAEWCEANESYFMNCQTGTNADAIRDPNNTTDIATTLTSAGYRFASTFAHATDPYAGISATKWLATVNYQAVASTLTIEGKKMSGVTAESLTGSAYAAMKQDTKKSMFYTVVDLQGSTDNGRIINSWSHSTFGEYIDDVVNLSAFVNDLTVSLYNVVMNQVTKLGQDPVGQSVLIGTAKAACERFIANNYLGPRNYLDPDDGQEKFTAGYEILTKPEDILNLTDPERDERKSAPLRIRIFRKGAIHYVPVDISVY